MPPTTARPHRLLFCTLSGFGHIFPMLPLAVAAREAGHEVLFATGAEAVPAVSRAGFTARPMGISIPQCISELAGGMPVTEIPDEIRPKLVYEAFSAELPRHTIRDLTPICTELAPDLIVYNQWDLGPAVVAAAAGIPTIEFKLSRVHAPNGDRSRTLPPGDPSRAALFAANGVADPAVPRFLDIFPPNLQEPAVLDDPRRQPMRPVAWADPGADVPDWVRAERSRPLVYLTLGTTPHDVRALRTALAGLAEHDVDVLVALGQIAGDSLPTSDRVRVAQWVDQTQVLRHADLVVHHGGSGTTLGTAAAGLPQLVLPQRGDQFSQASAVASAGVGRMLPPGAVTPEAVTEAVQALLGSTGYRQAAEATRAEIEAMPTPAEVLSRVVEIADSGEREAGMAYTGS